MDQSLRAAKFAASDVSEMEIEVKVEKEPIYANEWKNDPIIGKSEKKQRSDQILKPIMKEKKCQ